MDRDSKQDVASFVNQYKQKIDEDISKMIQFGEVIYSGKSMKTAGNVKIYLKGMWVLIVDPGTQNVITLYNVDLGLGDEMNDAFVEKAKAKIEEARQKVEEEKEKAQTDKQNYMELIDENTATINEYRKLIRQLEAQNAGYTEVVKSLTANAEVAESQYREAVMILTAKNKF